MQTEVVKPFKWGFVLSEQELRRIYQSCLDNCKKAGCEEPKHSAIVKLQDGSIINSNNIEEALSLENSGSKSIEKLELKFDDGSTDPRWSISISFIDGYKAAESWDSAVLEVKSDSRDWAFITAAELEERLKKVTIISWSYVISRKWMSIVMMLLLMVTMFGSTAIFTDFNSFPQPGAALQEQYDKGLITDPIKAIIFIENFRVENRPSMFNSLMPTLISTVVVMLLYMFALFVLPRARTNYNFYWGDHISIYDKQQSRIKAIIAFVIFGVLASLIAGWIQQI